MRLCRYEGWVVVKQKLCVYTYVSLLIFSVTVPSRFPSRICVLSETNKLSKLQPIEQSWLPLLTRSSMSGVCPFSTASRSAVLYFGVVISMLALPCTCTTQHNIGKKVQIAHTRLPSVGFRSSSRFLADSLQVM